MKGWLQRICLSLARGFEKTRTFEVELEWDGKGWRILNHYWPVTRSGMYDNCVVGERNHAKIKLPYDSKGGPSNPAFGEYVEAPK